MSFTCAISCDIFVSVVRLVLDNMLETDDPSELFPPSIASFDGGPLQSLLHQFVCICWQFHSW
jgi:hypothetical protein